MRSLSVIFYAFHHGYISRCPTCLLILSETLSQEQKPTLMSTCRTSNAYAFAITWLKSLFQYQAMSLNCTNLKLGGSVHSSATFRIPIKELHRFPNVNTSNSEYRLRSTAFSYCKNRNHSHFTLGTFHMIAFQLSVCRQWRPNFSGLQLICSACSPKESMPSRW